MPEFASSHLQVPTPLLLENGRIRVYFATRDDGGRSHTTFVEIDQYKDYEVVYEHQSPVLALGKAGTFDADGVMVNQVVETKEYGVLLLYTGWSRAIDVPYKTMAGIAKSKDGGMSFERFSDGPLLGIDRIDPYFINTPFLTQDTSSLWHLFYSSGINWLERNGRMEPQYQIRRATSNNLSDWRKENSFILSSILVNESNVRPWVIQENNGYRIFYSFRGTEDFRDGEDSYKIAFASSNDILNWSLSEEIQCPAEFSGNVLKMNAYPAILELSKSEKIVFFNGTSFGMHGFYLGKINQ